MSMKAMRTPFPQLNGEASIGGVQFLEISQNSQENTCVRASFLIKLQALRLKDFLRVVP